MMNEFNTAREFLIKKFGKAELIKPGTYPVPCNTSRGKAFMKVIASNAGYLSDFHLFKDEALTISWYLEDQEKG